MATYGFTDEQIREAHRRQQQATYWKDTATTLGRMLRAERVDYAKLERKLAFYMIVAALGWGTLVMALINGWAV